MSHRIEGMPSNMRMLSLKQAFCQALQTSQAAGVPAMKLVSRDVCLLEHKAPSLIC